jgi:hypothetical protein
MEQDEKMILGKGIVAFIMNMFIICLVRNLFLIESCTAETTFYVNATTNPGGDGTQGSPFNTIYEDITAAKPGDTVPVLSRT